MARENADLLGAIADLERERGIDHDTLIEAVEAALVSAYRRNYGSGENVGVRIDRQTGAIDVYVSKTVADEVADPVLEIAVGEAKEIDPVYEVGDVIEFPVAPRDFGRIAAQTAKQVVVQRLREAERGMIYDEYAQREGDVVTGVIQRVQGRNAFIDLGKTEALLLPSEQMAGEYPQVGDRLRVYIVEVKKTSKGPQVLVSRTHPGLLKRLFELEVPEIHDGLVEVKGIAREAGARSKLAVCSRDENVDPVGACVGHKGMRVQSVVSELRGEKVDIIKWSGSPAEYVANALSPAKASRVIIDEADKVARVVVPDYQLSLAIGRAGQNARLAAKLTGWRIDIRSESQLTDADLERAVTPGAASAPWAAGTVDRAPAEAPLFAPWQVVETPPSQDLPVGPQPAAAETTPVAPSGPAVRRAGPVSHPKAKTPRRTVTRKRAAAAEKKTAHKGAGRSLFDALAEAGLVTADTPAEGGGEADAVPPAAAPAADAPAPVPEPLAEARETPARKRRKKPVILDDEPLPEAEVVEVYEDRESAARVKRRPRKAHPPQTEPDHEEA